MRRVLISLLLASAAASPALSQDTRADRQQMRVERQQARSDARAERQQVSDDRQSSTADRPQFSRPDRQPPQPDTQRQSFDAAAHASPQADADTRRAGRNARRDNADALRSERIEQVQQRFQERQNQVQQMRERGDLRQSDRPVPRVMRNPVPVVSDTPRAGTQPPMPTVHRTAPVVQWNTNWRKDHKYDWYDWRRRHRWLFNLGFYYDPYGWGYYPYQTGWRLWPSYYSSRYWLQDPWYYRLPYAPAGYRWIRYWDDALLVDTFTGEVVDVIPNFFW